MCSPCKKVVERYAIRTREYADAVARLGRIGLLPSEQDLLTGQNTAPTINVAALVSII